MSEVTKLYDNAGIEQTQDITCGDCEFVNYPEENKPCNACTQYGIKHHPPFTAEKQIELYCFILSQNKYVMTFEATLPLTPDAFAEGVAEATNHIWQSLSEEEKQQVKGILE